MLEQLDHVHQAVQLLVGRNVRLEERFPEAAQEFVSALHRCDQWPKDVVEKARAIERKLTARGSIEATIDEMDAAAIEEIADAILDIADAIALADAEAAEPEPDGEDVFEFALAHCRYRADRKGHKRRRQRKAILSPLV